MDSVKEVHVNGKKGSKSKKDLENAFKVKLKKINGFVKRYLKGYPNVNSKTSFTNPEIT